MKLGNNEKKKKKKIRQRRVKKKRDKDLQDFTRNAQKCNGRLMYKTKGVEPNPRVERNKKYEQRSQGSHSI